MPTWIADSPQRLDVFLASDERTLSRARAQKLIEEGFVQVNGKKQRKCSCLVGLGDEVTLAADIPAAPSTVQAAPMPLTILYEDDACMVLSKPAGIAVHPGAGMEDGEVTLLSGIAHLFAERTLPFSGEAVLVHRLDRETTGCILIAKSPAAHLALQAQFEHRTVKKLYLALVAGVPVHPTATIDSPIGRSQTDRTKMSVRGVSGVREAQTTYRVVESTDDIALVECDLHTGRTHQVRVHLHSIGHPVLGDPTYTLPFSERLAAQYGIDNLCLHAWKLTFQSPAKKKPQTVEASLPEVYRGVMERCGIHFKSLSSAKKTREK